MARPAPAYIPVGTIANFPLQYPSTPREMLDPSVEMTVESGIVLAEEYVPTLDFSSNEFLNAKALP